MLVLSRKPQQSIVLVDRRTGSIAGTLHLVKISGRGAALAFEGFDGFDIKRSELIERDSADVELVAEPELLDDESLAPPHDERRAGAIDAMEALFKFSEAMQREVSTNDLCEVMSIAVADGWDMLIIELHMAIEAAKLARSRRAVADRDYLRR